MYRDLELVFGYESSKCLGINLANLEMNKTVFEVLLSVIKKNPPEPPPPL